MILTSVLIALPVTFLSEPIISILFGTQYSAAAGVLSIHIWAGVFVFLGVSVNNWFLAENLQIYSFYRTLLGCIANIALNLILIPKWGIQGAAVSTLISQFIVGYISLLFFAKSRYIFYRINRSLNIFLLPKRLFGTFILYEKKTNRI
jgi:O-antigen/teichoic acid export membrane protein